jgi:hypothetical protein
MLPYRLFMLLVLLVGLGLGLLVPRPWSDVPEAQAARKNNGAWLCLGKGVMLHNMSSKPIGYKISLLQADGTEVASVSDSNLGSANTAGLTNPAATAAIVSVNGEARLLGIGGTLTDPQGFSECVASR